MYFNLSTNISWKISLDTISIKTSCEISWMTFTTKPHEQKLQKNSNVLMNSHLQWTIYLTMYYPQNWNCCNLSALLHSGMMDPHCGIIVTYWWWSMFCMISISFTHLRNINKKQVNSFKIAMRQLNSSDQICIFILSSMVAPQLHFWISLKDVKYFSFSPTHLFTTSFLQKSRSFTVMPWKNTDNVFYILCYLLSQHYPK